LLLKECVHGKEKTMETEKGQGVVIGQATTWQSENGYNEKIRTTMKKRINGRKGGVKKKMRGDQDSTNAETSKIAE